MTELFNQLLYAPLFNLLVFLYNIIPGNDIGIAIILLTVAIKLILLPLSIKSTKSQKALQDLQPKMEEIKKQYKDKKEEQAKALMELYKSEKVNPLSSCFPLLIQLPFLIAVFQILRNGFKAESLDMVYPFISRPEVLNSVSFGVDLAENNIVLAVLAGGAQYWQTKMLMHKKQPIKSGGGKDENMASIMNKQMMYMMPVLTVFIGIGLPGGLTLYWLATTLLMVAQQKLMFKKTLDVKVKKPKN
jgi:YidC/Oxa1 family membrane protein insertase